MLTAFDGTGEKDRVIKGLRIMADKTGIHGMLGGQSVDVENDGKPVDREVLDYIYQNKTSALIECAMMTGAVLAGATEEAVKVIEEAARNIGLAFQIQDDILDVTGDQAVLGKAIGSDANNQKTTFVSVYGLETCRSMVRNLTQQALAAAEVFEDGEFLKELALYLAQRNK